MEAIQSYPQETPDALDENFLREYFAAEVDAEELARLQQEQLLHASVELFGHPSAIPTQNRLRFLIGDEELARTSYQFTDADELAARLGIDHDTLLEIIAELNVPADLTRIDNFKNVSLAPGLDVVIAEELEWRRTYKELPDKIPIKRVAAVFGRDDRAMKGMLQSTGITAQRLHVRGSTYGHYYPKQLLHYIRAKIMIFPPARSAKTVDQISQSIHSSQDWVKDRIDEDVDSDLMWSARSQLETHYFGEFEQKLTEQRETPDPDMMEIGQMARELGRKDEWVKARILKFRKHRRTFIVRGVERTFYYRPAFESLRQESERQRKVPELGDNELTFNSLTDPFSTGDEVVERVLGRIGAITLTRRLPANNLIVPAYDAGIQIPLAVGIIEDRQRQIEQHQTTVAALASTPKEILTDEERKRLKMAKQQIGIMSRLLSRAQADYEKLLENDKG